MIIIYFVIAIPIIFLLKIIFSFAIRGGNFYLLPRNITRMYNIVKNQFSNCYSNASELLFITGMLSARSYIKNDKGIIHKIYIAALDSSIPEMSDTEVAMICKFSELLMFEFFLIDSKSNSDIIIEAIYEEKETIKQSVTNELKNNKVLSYTRFIAFQSSISEIKNFLTVFTNNDL